MRKHTKRSLAAVVIGLALTLGVLPAAAQDGPSRPASGRDPIYEEPPGALLVPGNPPEVGEVVLEDPLTGPGALTGVRCPTGRNAAEFVGEGLIFKVTGGCFQGSAGAAIYAQEIPRLIVPDGEVRLELKVVSGHDRAGFLLVVRSQESLEAYQASFVPAQGRANLAKVGGGVEILASRRDLIGASVAVADWNAVAMRLDGQNLWFLVNDEPMLSATDASFERGRVTIGLFRTGDPTSGQESAVVVRNLRVSKLAPRS